MDKPNNPIRIMADALAEMTERAILAERQRDAATEDAANWYQLYQSRDKQLEETRNLLEAEIDAHHNTRLELQRALNPENNRGEG